MQENPGVNNLNGIPNFGFGFPEEPVEVIEVVEEVDEKPKKGKKSVDNAVDT
jgi:hypothetical protein